ncbi:hypothetical protein BCR44DRAFT_40633 [Catenaria anguillulae PL171]|uniref:Uncharacterized protein n=1 Tax=Catenaria anguillulae PL171 TaxID=765915 RepID=A0A1Y2HLC8_9FUNG|nr:hypothetical protein BCR44DRAFT_40633 [Catenaria anguillulae PL171]
MNAHRRAQPFVHQPPPQQRPIGSGLQQRNPASRQQSTAAITQNGPMHQQQQPQQPQPGSPPIPTHDPTRKRSQFLSDELFQTNNNNVGGNPQQPAHQQSQLQQPQSYLFRNDPPATSFSTAAPAAARTNPPSFLNPPTNPTKPPQHQKPQDPAQWSLSDLLADILRDKDTVTIIDFLSTVIDHERLYDVTLVEDSFMNMLFQWTEENDCADMPMSQEDLLVLLDQLKEVNDIKDDDSNAAAHGQGQQLPSDQQQQGDDNGFVDQRFFTVMTPGTPAAKRFSALTPAKQRMFMQIVTPLSMRKRGIHPPTRQPQFGAGGGAPSGIPKPTTFESRIPRPTALGAKSAAGALQPHEQHQHHNQHGQHQPWSTDPVAKESDDHHYMHEQQRAPSDIAITDHHPPLTGDFWLSDQDAAQPTFPPPAANDKDGHHQRQRPSPADQPDAPLRYHDLFGSDIPAPAEMDHVPAHQHQQKQAAAKYGLYSGAANINNTGSPEHADLGTPISALPSRNAFLARGTAAERDLLLEYETQIQTLNHHVASLKSQVQQYKQQVAEAAEHEAQIMHAIDEFHAHARKLKRKIQWYHDELHKARAEVDEAVRREEALMGKVDELEREAKEARDREVSVQEECRQVVEEWRAVLAERDELQVMLYEARKDGAVSSGAPALAGGKGSEIGGQAAGGRQFADAGAGSMSLGAELISGSGAALMGNMDPDTALRMGRLEAENEHLRRLVNAHGGNQGGGGRNLIPKVHAEVQAGKSAWDPEEPAVMCDAEVMVRPDRFPCGTQYMDPEKVAQWAEMGIIEDEPDTMVSGLHDDYDAGEGIGGMTDIVDNEQEVGLSVVPEGEEEVEEEERMEEAELPDPMSPTPVRVAGPGGSTLFDRHRPSAPRPLSQPQPSAPSVATPPSLKTSPRKSDKPSLMSQAGFDKRISLRDRIKLLTTGSVLGKPGLLVFGVVVLALLGVIAAVLVHVIMWPSHGTGSGFGGLGPDFNDDIDGTLEPLIESSPVLDPGYYCLIGIRHRVEDVLDAAPESDL